MKSDMYDHVFADIRRSGDGDSIRPLLSWVWSLEYNPTWGNQLLCVFFDPVRPPMRVPVTHASLLCPFSNHKTHPAFIHSF